MRTRLNLMNLYKLNIHKKNCMIKKNVCCNILKRKEKLRFTLKKNSPLESDDLYFYIV